MNRQPTVAVLLAAGRGRRARPETDHTPKPLLPVAGRPTLDYVLTAAARAGIRDVVVVTHYLAEQIEHYVGDGTSWGLRVVCCRQPHLGGTAHALQTAITDYPALFDRERPFVLSATDYALAPDALTELVTAHAANGADMTVSLKQFPSADILGRSSVVLGSDGLIVQIIEKPAPEQIAGPWVASLLFVLPGAVLDYLWDSPASPRGEVEIQSVINRLLDGGFTAGGLVQEAPREWEATLISGK